MGKPEKDVFKLASVILAVLIVFAVFGGGFLLFSSGGKGAGSGSLVEKTELKAAGPSKKEMELSGQITVSAGGAAVAEKKKEEGKESADRTAADYILPESNSRIMTEADVEGLSLKELNYAKNEIYARHGRKFQSKELQDYFGSKSWYEGKYEGNEFDATYGVSLLSDIEKKNAEFLKKKEFAMSSGGYKLDQ